MGRPRHSGFVHIVIHRREQRYPHRFPQRLRRPAVGPSAYGAFRGRGASAVAPHGTKRLGRRTQSCCLFLGTRVRHTTFGGRFPRPRQSVRRDVAVSRETVDKGWHIGPCASEAEVLEVAQVQGHWEGDRADYARNCPQSYPQGYPLMRLDTDTALGARPPISVTHSPGPRGVPAGLPHRT